MKDDFASLVSHEFDMTEFTGKPMPNAPWSWPGEANPMWGKRGELSPHFGKTRPQEYCEELSAKIEESWVGDESRRKATSERMAKMWEDGRVTFQARANGNHGLKGKDIHNTLSIEYRGVTYFGWRELKSATGVSKHLYLKYYVNGMNPEQRIGSSGPARKS